MPAYSTSSHSNGGDVPKKVPQLLKMAKETQDDEKIADYMRTLAQIGNKEAAVAFTDIFEARIMSSKLRRTPLITLVSKFDLEADEIKAVVVPFLQTILANNPERLDKIVISGILARLGDEHSVEYLIHEYQKSLSISTQEEENFRNSLVKELCTIHSPEALQIINKEIQEHSGDPTPKLFAIGIMLRSNNPYALELVRQHIHVGSDDFDLMEARLYLKAIIKFGDQTDRTFLDHLSEYIEQPLHTLMKDDLQSLMMQAYEKLDNDRVK